MGKKLISLEKHNREECQVFYDSEEEPYFNGIECPRCREELVDSDPDRLMMSNPPRTYVECLDCGYIDRRIVSLKDV